MGSIKKYILTNETMEYDGHVLHRIQAVRSFYDVKEGELGGWLEKEENLSHYGDCWVADNAKVYGQAWVCGGAQVYGDAVVYGWAKVFGYADITGDAVIKEMGDYMVFQNTWSSGRFFTWTRSNDMWSVGCFYGSGKELIEKAYEDSEEKGDYYKLYVELVEKTKKFVGNTIE